MEIIESPYMQIIADLAKNNKNLTPELQNAIAKYLDVQTTPKLTVSPHVYTGGGLLKKAALSPPKPRKES